MNEQKIFDKLKEETPNEVVSLLLSEMQISDFYMSDSIKLTTEQAFAHYSEKLDMMKKGVIPNTMVGLEELTSALLACKENSIEAIRIYTENYSFQIITSDNGQLIGMTKNIGKNKGTFSKYLSELSKTGHKSKSKLCKRIIL